MHISDKLQRALSKQHVCADRLRTPRGGALGAICRRIASEFTCGRLGLERAEGIEPSNQPWEGYVLPLNYARMLLVLATSDLRGKSKYCLNASFSRRRKERRTVVDASVHCLHRMQITSRVNFMEPSLIIKRTSPPGRQSVKCPLSSAGETAPPAPPSLAPAILPGQMLSVVDMR
jgi:hypothetical protein